MLPEPGTVKGLIKPKNLGFFKMGLDSLHLTKYTSLPDDSNEANNNSSINFADHCVIILEPRRIRAELTVTVTYSRLK